MFKTKRELEIEKESLIEKLNKVNAELEKRQNIVNVEGDKPFNRFSMVQLNELFTANERAYNWFNEEENHEKTIDEYNATHKTNLVYV